VALQGIGPFVLLLMLTLFAGALLGAIIGLGQSLVLRRVDPAVERWRWIFGTALASVVVWVLAFLPEIIATALPGIQQTSEHQRLLMLIAPFAGFVLGAIVGAMQWCIAGRGFALTAFWIVVCAFAGAVVMPSIIAGTAYADAQSSAFGFWSVAVLTALLTALTSSIMTGATFISTFALPKRRERENERP
jgi:hypothetical protein